MTTTPLTSAHQIPLAHPNRPIRNKSSRNNKPTLVETLQGGRKDNDDDDADPLGPFGQALFSTATLSMLHFSLDVLVRHQYAQEIRWGEALWRMGTVAGPALLLLTTLLAYLLPNRASQTAPQLAFLLVAVASGCYLIRASNLDGYFAVMKRAPAVGTLWVWAVVEMRLAYAVMGLLAPLAYMWWRGFGFL